MLKKGPNFANYCSFILSISPQPVLSGAYIIRGTNFLLYDPNKYSSKRGKVIAIPTEH